MEKLSEAKSACGRKKILLIDDDADYIDSVKIFLEKDYEVVPALDAEEGWKKLEEEKPDLIIVDAMMPEKDGFVLAKEIRAHPIHRNIPLIMLTAVVPNIPHTKYSPDHILRYEGDDFIEKSAPMDDILSTVREYLPPSE